MWIETETKDFINLDHFGKVAVYDEGDYFEIVATGGGCGNDEDNSEIIATVYVDDYLDKTKNDRQAAIDIASKEADALLLAIMNAVTKEYKVIRQVLKLEQIDIGAWKDD